MMGFLLESFRPFMTPLRLEAQWLLLLLPMVVAISIVYKTIKLRDLRRVPQEAAMLAAQITLFMVLTASVLWLLTEVL